MRRWLRNKYMSERLGSNAKNALDANFLKTMVKGDVVVLLLERFG
jgi:hypothetical protein